MQNDDTTAAPLDVGLTDVQAMFAKRGYVLDAEEHPLPIEVLSAKAKVHWAFRRSYVANKDDATRKMLGAVAVEDLNKDTARSVMAAYAKEKLDYLVVVHNGGCTKDGLSEISAGNVEHWNATRLYLNPFKFSFFHDARLVNAPPGADPDSLKKMARMIVSDPVARYLGAKVGQIVEVDMSWGPLEPTQKLRLVVPV